MAKQKKSKYTRRVHKVEFPIREGMLIEYEVTKKNKTKRDSVGPATDLIAQSPDDLDSENKKEKRTHRIGLVVVCVRKNAIRVRNLLLTKIGRDKASMGFGDRIKYPHETYIVATFDHYEKAAYYERPPIQRIIREVQISELSADLLKKFKAHLNQTAAVSKGRSSVSQQPQLGPYGKLAMKGKVDTLAGLASSLTGQDKIKWPIDSLTISSTGKSGEVMLQVGDKVQLCTLTETFENGLTRLKLEFIKNR